MIILLQNSFFFVCLLNRRIFSKQNMLISVVTFKVTFVVSVHLIH